MAAAPSDSRMDTFKHILYPLNSHLPLSPAPSGAHHPDHLARVQAVLPNPEVHETIERAFKLLQRHRRRARTDELRIKFKAMEVACDDLNEITMPKKGKETYDRAIYVAAAKRPDPWAKPKPVGKRISPEEVWKEARIEGLMPREIWVPTETRGKGWNYEWKRPSSA
jgi:large subunit ribosomal protein L40